jgi:hypothetical protein
MSPFDFLNSINDSKKNLFNEDPQCEKDYSPYMINRGLSYFPDTIMFANEMNTHYDIPKKWQYEFYLNGITKKKRFSKWSKKDNTQDVIKIIMAEYNYSERNALEIINILDTSQIDALVTKYSTGGR